jgi:hypothetical protein
MRVFGIMLTVFALVWLIWSLLAVAMTVGGGDD